MSDWQVGDLAKLIKDGLHPCDDGKFYHSGESCPPLNSVRRVADIGPSFKFTSPGCNRCCCLTLIFDDSTMALASRCRKIRHDQQEGSIKAWKEIVDKHKAKETTRN